MAKTQKLADVKSRVTPSHDKIGTPPRYQGTWHEMHCFLEDASGSQILAYQGEDTLYTTMSSLASIGMSVCLKTRAGARLKCCLVAFKANSPIY